MEPQTERKALGQVIRALRELEGLSREELGTRADLGVDMVAKVEQGAKAPSAAALKRLASALGLDPIDLSNRGLLWAAIQDSPEASTALLRSVATGASAAMPAIRRVVGLRSGPGSTLGAGLPMGLVALGAAAGATYLKDKTSRREIEQALRKRLEERLAEAKTPEDLESLALALEAADPQDPAPAD